MAYFDFMEKLVNEIRDFSRFKTSVSEVMDIMLYNDLSGLGGKQEKVGNKLVTTIREKYRGVDLVNIPAEVEKKLDIIQNEAGDILGFRSSCLAKDKSGSVMKVTKDMETNTMFIFGKRNQKSLIAPHYDLTMYDSKGLPNPLPFN